MGNLIDADKHTGVTGELKKLHGRDTKETNLCGAGVTGKENTHTHTHTYTQ
ncbi:hypothetical protein EXN66_Car012376 [Channa argus]|uniref:Uncharacterized protein n=1 Tax=Channa argus TaxID=215402 RepID=A0A6G1Q358_CHAAH|nr:hypothetical protein EXN66_Car012376 [Channa argus]